MYIGPAMQNVADLFDALGGPSKVARILGVGTSTASEMKRRGSIPVRYWEKLLRDANDRELPDVNEQALIRLHAPAEQGVAA